MKFSKSVLIGLLAVVVLFGAVAYYAGTELKVDGVTAASENKED